MGWKTVVWAGCLVPVLAGCGAFRHSANNAAGDTEPGPPRSQGTHDQRRAAGAAWRMVRDRHPYVVFPDKFRDGFLDGYAAYIEQGRAAQPSASVGERLAGTGSARDYQLGFQYAADVAVVTGYQSAGQATDPVRVSAGAQPGPKLPPAPRPAHSEPAIKFDGASDPDPEPRVRLPKPELPVIKPFNPPLLDDANMKFAPLPVPTDPDKLPAPYPPLPVPRAVPSGSALEPVPTLPVPTLTMPAPEAAVPSILGEIPAIPFRFAPPAPPVSPPK